MVLMSPFTKHEEEFHFEVKKTELRSVIPNTSGWVIRENTEDPLKGARRPARSTLRYTSAK